MVPMGSIFLSKFEDSGYEGTSYTKMFLKEPIQIEILGSKFSACSIKLMLIRSYKNHHLHSSITGNNIS